MRPSLLSATANGARAAVVAQPTPARFGLSGMSSLPSHALGAPPAHGRPAPRRGVAVARGVKRGRLSDSDDGSGADGAVFACAVRAPATARPATYGAAGAAARAARAQSVDEFEFNLT